MLLLPQSPTPVSSCASGSYSHGVADGVTCFPRGTVAPLLPAVLSPPAQAQMGRQNVLNSSTHQKTGTQLAHKTNKNIRTVLLFQVFGAHIARKPVCSSDQNLTPEEQEEHN